MRADTLRIPTVAVTVDLALGPAQPRVESGELFVFDDTRHGNVIEAVAMLLETSSQFIPFRTADVVRLVAKSAIVSVTIREPRAAESEGEPELELYDRQHRVEVMLVQGTRFEGLLLDNSPAEHPRAIDHLNSSASYVRLWTAENRVLIAKAQIVTVTELSEPE